jgi:sec-independent protein translocase protein TatC
MTFVEHLDELRHRLIISLGAIVVGAIAGWFLSGAIIHLIDAPIRQYLGGQRLIVPEIYGAFTLHLKVAIVVGFIFALPVTLWQIWGFVALLSGRRPTATHR